MSGRLLGGGDICAESRNRLLLLDLSILKLLHYRSLSELCRGGVARPPRNWRCQGFAM